MIRAANQSGVFQIISLFRISDEVEVSQLAEPPSPNSYEKDHSHFHRHLSTKQAKGTRMKNVPDSNHCP